ncbi:MAG: NAD(P)/FAD-dependent oxidoreductase [Solirubrobacterales bacterium]|nr:NAD(P)/FAD-dependent oxidoreductase [Solirubrobacterales bacterium]
MSALSTNATRGDHRVVVIGGGFGGLRAVRHLRDAPVSVTLIDRRNFHLFQPLSYQVATGALSPSDVAYPLRALFAGSDNVRVLLADASGFDLDAREVRLAPAGDESIPDAVPYDTLIVAAGSSYSYFGHEEWREHAAEVKSMESAIVVCSEILAAFERAELATDPGARAAELTFVVVGGGPTGVEMAGQIGELARHTLRHDFRSIDPTTARVLLIETTDRLLGSFPASLSEKARRGLERIGVTPMLDTTVVDIDEKSVVLEDGQGARETVPTRTVVWAAGVQASSLATTLGELAGGEIDRSGRLTVESDLSLAGHPEVLVLGDMVRVRDADGQVQTLPGVAPVAIQQGVYAGRLIVDRLHGAATAPFHYHDKGNVATIGRGRAVVDLGWLRLSGLPAWVAWLVIHIWYLIGFRNRLFVALQWFFSFVSHGRSSRLIVEPDDIDVHEVPTSD